MADNDLTFDEMPYIPLTRVKATDAPKDNSIEESFRKNWNPTVNVVDGSLNVVQEIVKKDIMDRITHEYVKEILGCEPMTGPTDAVFAMRPICNIYDACYNKGEIMILS